MKRSEHKSLTECDPTPSMVIYDSRWVWGSIRAVTDVALDGLRKSRAH